MFICYFLFIMRRILLLLLIFPFVFLGSGCRFIPKQYLVNDRPSLNKQGLNNSSSTVVLNNNQKTITHDDSIAKNTTTTEIGDLNPVLAYLVMVKNSKVKITRGTEITDGVPDMELYLGDKIEVLNGEVRLLYPDTGLSVLTQGTTVILSTEDDVENIDSNSLKTKIILEAGSIWTRLERLLGVDDDFEVESGDLVATVRGTAFAVENDNGDVSVIVADHKVAVFDKQINKNTTRSQIILSKGYKIVVPKGSLNKSAGQLRRQMLRKIRRLNSLDKNKTLYRFAQRPLLLSSLKKPKQAFRWSAPLDTSKLKTRIDPKLLNRLELLKKQQLKDRPALLQKEQELRLLKLKSTQFQLPVRTILQSEIQPNIVQPSVDGPKIQQ